MPLEDWPAYGFKRRQRRAKGKRWHVLAERDKTCNEVLARLRGEGPLTANELGGAKKGGPWWDWSETKIAAEWLLDIGELVCRERRGFARVYDLAERAIPAALLAEDWTDEECAVRLVAAAGRSHGRGDGGRPGRVPRRAAAAGAPGAGGVRAWTKVSVAGWKQAAYADPGALGAVGTRMRGRTVMLSPFDSLIWYRDRVERLFDLRHRLEAYTPKEKRIYGYFAMPVLDGTRMVGLVDPGPAGRCAGGQAGDAAPARCGGAGGRALAEAASWVGCTRVRCRARGAGVGEGCGAGGAGGRVRRLRAQAAERCAAMRSKVRDVASIGSRLGGVVEDELIEAELGVPGRRARRTGRVT